MHQVATDIYYVSIVISILSTIAYVPNFSALVARFISRWLPIAKYISHVKNKRENGHTSRYFTDFEYPDIIGTKYLLPKLIFKKDGITACFVFSIYAFVPQYIFYNILGIVINTERYWLNTYFLYEIAIFDYLIFTTCFVAITAAKLEALRNEVQEIILTTHPSEKRLSREELREETLNLMADLKLKFPFGKNKDDKP